MYKDICQSVIYTCDKLDKAYIANKKRMFQ
jgi:hypothetical protein